MQDLFVVLYTVIESISNGRILRIAISLRDDIFYSICSIDSVSNLSLKRISDREITSEIYRQTNKTLSKSGLYRVTGSSSETPTNLRQDHERRTIRVYPRVQGTY